MKSLHVFVYISILKNVSQVYMPVMWFGVNADLTDKLLGWIHFTLIGPYIGSFCFFLFFVASMVVVAKSGVKYSKRERIQPKNQETEAEGRKIGKTKDEQD